MFQKTVPCDCHKQPYIEGSKRPKPSELASIYFAHFGLLRRLPVRISPRSFPWLLKVAPGGWLSKPRTKRRPNPIPFLCYRFPRYQYLHPRRFPTAPTFSEFSLLLYRLSVVLVLTDLFGLFKTWSRSHFYCTSFCFNHKSKDQSCELQPQLLLRPARNILLSNWWTHGNPYGSPHTLRKTSLGT